MIYHVKESEFCHQGINWRCNPDTLLCIIIKLWRFSWYFRIRPNHLCKAPNSCKRFVSNFNYSYYDKDGYERIFGNLWYNWDMRAFKAGDKRISEEYLLDFIEMNGV